MTPFVVIMLIACGVVVFFIGFVVGGWRVEREWWKAEEKRED